MTYTTDCFRKIKNEDGTVEVKRWVEERPVRTSIHTDPETGFKFWKGARVR